MGAQSKSVFKTTNRMLLNVSGISTNTQPFSEVEVNDGIMRIELKRMSGPSSAWTKIKDFPANVRIVNAWFNALVGSASHSVRFAKSASSTSVIFNVPVVTSASGYATANRMVHARTRVAKGDTLLVGCSGAAASTLRGTLYVQYMPV